MDKIKKHRYIMPTLTNDAYKKSVKYVLCARKESNTQLVAYAYVR